MCVCCVEKHKTETNGKTTKSSLVIYKMILMPVDFFEKVMKFMIKHIKYRASCQLIECLQLIQGMTAVHGIIF